jgi:tetratricopeptide (TPR) repeat protein
VDCASRFGPSVSYSAGMGRTPHRQVLIVALVVLASVCALVVSRADAHGPLEERIASMTRRIERQPSNAILYLQRGELHRVAGHRAAAERDYERAHRLDPCLREVHLARAQLFFDDDEPSAALSAVDIFLAGEPDDATALFLRGNIKGRLGQTAEALSDMDRALDLMRSPRPAHYIIRSRLTTASFDSARGLRRALEGLDEGMRRLGLVVSLQLEAVDLETRLCNFDAALARLDALSRQYVRKDIILVRRGEVLEAAGRRLEADALYTQALDLIRDSSILGRSSVATRRLEARVRSKLREDNGSAP